MKTNLFTILLSSISIFGISQNLLLPPSDPNYATEKLKLIDKSVTARNYVLTQKMTSVLSCNCMISRDNTFTATMGGDDLNYGISLPFNFCFYGNSYSSCKISTNGNIQFASNYNGFSSSSFPSGTLDMIAPFWADLDINPANGSRLSYKITSTALIVKWDSCGYYNGHVDKRNTFQVIITDGTDPLLPPGKNVSFCYGDMQWTTGDASGGVNGFPANSSGVPATVGANRGDNVNYFQIGRFGAPGIGYNGPYNADDSLDVLDNMHFVFDVCSTGNVAPFTSDNICDTTYIQPMQIVNGQVYIYAPEITQSITVNASEQSFKTNSNAFSITNIQNVQGGAIVSYQFDASQVTPGSRIKATISGTDGTALNGTYSHDLYFVVGNVVTGIAEKEKFEKPFIFPNPANNMISITNTDDVIMLEILDALGNIVARETLNKPNEKNVSINQLSNGYYTAKIYSKTKLLNIQKLIISK